jgi:hypothetical protein
MMMMMMMMERENGDRETQREFVARCESSLDALVREDGFFLGRERRKSAHKNGRERERKAKTTLGSLSLSLSLVLGKYNTGSYHSRTDA